MMHACMRVCVRTCVRVAQAGGKGIITTLINPPRHSHSQPAPPVLCCRDGLHIDLGFFRDVLIPPHGLPEPSYWHEDDEVCVERGVGCGWLRG